MKTFPKFALSILAALVLGACPSYAFPVVSAPTLFGDSTLTTASSGGALAPYFANYNVVSTGDNTQVGGLSQADFYTLIGAAGSPTGGLFYSGYYVDITGASPTDTFSLGFNLLTNNPTTPGGDWGFGFVNIDSGQFTQNSAHFSDSAPYLGTGFDGYSAGQGATTSGDVPITLFASNLRVVVWTDIPDPGATPALMPASAIAFGLAITTPAPEIDHKSSGTPIALSIGVLLLLSDRRRRFASTQVA